MSGRERTSARKRAAERDYTAAADKLRSLLPPGSTVYCVLRHRSRSGMQRVIDPLIFDADDGRPFRLAYYMRDLGFRVDSKRDGIVVNGCGMDMGWHLVFTLSRLLYPNGFGCIGDSTDGKRACPSNDHSNGDRDYTPHVDDTPRNSAEVGTDIPRLRSHRHWHREGSYALRMEWV